MAGSAEGRHFLFGERHFACDFRVDREIFGNVRILARAVPIALLANKDFSGIHRLSSEALYATAFRTAVSAVLGGASCFLMCHSAGIVGKCGWLASAFLPCFESFIAFER